ncbi:hypothetical protein A4F85_01145 [Delftia sp. GW456-R20]|uniref:hypothetical protein n=1 Tax=Delftia sp. GW456-R20 TaxID=1827145 RepID=UPI0007AEA8AF|nr:hypothetical protein [Delftia sp. GW456-R20]KZK32393.1 hypothetical protein A4F85_01145 [Delftia sp. GW456-R20]
MLARPGRRRRRPQLVAELDPGLQLLDVVATAALRAGLVVDLHVWASWSSTRRWPGPGGAAAGRSWSMSSTRTCSCSMWWPCPRYTLARSRICVY